MGRRPRAALSAVCWLGTALAGGLHYVDQELMALDHVTAAAQLLAKARHHRNSPSLLAPAFGSYMVLHADGAALFGHADAEGLALHVTATTADGHLVASTSTTSATAGTWIVHLSVPASTMNYTINVSSSSGQQVTLTHVLFGVVLLCSGQSNMDVRGTCCSLCWPAALQ